MTTEKSILGIVAGLATGVILGVLFAPNKGSETRSKIGKKSKYLKDEIKSKYNGVVNNIAEKIDDIEQNTENLIKKSKEILNKI
jgi:gas vesicle protein